MPIFRINSEGDIAGGIGNGARAADSPTFRNWEVAGASHGDWKLITDYGPLRKRDIGTYPGGYPGEPQTCTLPSLSRVPQHMVQNALYDHTFKLGRVRHRAAVGAGDHHDDPDGRHRRARQPRPGAGRHPPLAARGRRCASTAARTPARGFCFLDGSSVPLTDAQLATLYPTVQSYVDKVVAATLANAAKGYIPADFTRDPAWYTDIRDLVSEYGARIPANTATNLRPALAHAPRSTARRTTSTRRSSTSSMLADEATRGIRPTPPRATPCCARRRRVIALLRESIDPPTSTTTTGHRRRHRAGHAVADPRHAGDVRGLHAGRGAATTRPRTTATVITTAGDATLSVSDPGHLTNGAFSLAEPLRVEFGKSAWTAPTSNETVGITFKQLIEANDALRTGTYSKTLTFTLSTTTP